MENYYLLFDMLIFVNFLAVDIFFVTDASSVATVVDATFIKPCEIEDKK